MRYKHVIWDWNGTLLDDTALCVEVMNTLLARRNMQEVTVDIYRDNFDFPVRKYYDFLGFSTDDSFEIISHEFIALFTTRSAEAKLHSDARELLADIHEKGVEQVILSAHHQDSLEAIVTYYGLRNYFEKLIGLDNIYAASKIANGQNHSASLEHAPHEVLLIGDTLHDAEVAQAIGADCLLVSDGHQSTKRLKTFGCPVVDSLAEARKFLEIS